jgi:hypothetical protein
MVPFAFPKSKPIAGFFLTLNLSIFLSTKSKRSVGGIHPLAFRRWKERKIVFIVARTRGIGHDRRLIRGSVVVLPVCVDVQTDSLGIIYKIPRSFQIPPLIRLAQLMILILID